MKGDMVYVAVKPKTPDLAYALCVDDIKDKKMTAAVLSGWLNEGARIMHVNHTVGWQMFDKYLESRPKKESLLNEN